MSNQCSYIISMSIIKYTNYQFCSISNTFLSGLSLDVGDSQDNFVVGSRPWLLSLVRSSFSKLQQYWHPFRRIHFKWKCYFDRYTQISSNHRSEIKADISIKVWTSTRVRNPNDLRLFDADGGDAGLLNRVDADAETRVDSDAETWRRIYPYLPCTWGVNVLTRRVLVVNSIF